MCCTSPVVKPLAVNEITISSTPDSRRCCFLTSCDSKLASRSLGTSMSTGPTSVSNFLVRVPLRELALFRPAASCSSYLGSSDISAAARPPTHPCQTRTTTHRGRPAPRHRSLLVRPVAQRGACPPTSASPAFSYLSLPVLSAKPQAGQHLRPAGICTGVLTLPRADCRRICGAARSHEGPRFGPGGGSA